MLENPDSIRHYQRGGAMKYRIIFPYPGKDDQIELFDALTDDKAVSDAKERVKQFKRSVHPQDFWKIGEINLFNLSENRLVRSW
jgi:hypothetical protein